MDLETHLKIIREQDFSRYELESELAALRQIVADVETCIGGRPDNSVEIFTEPGLVSVDNEQFHAPTWQAALHAAAEQVRNTNPERTENEV